MIENRKLCIYIILVSLQALLASNPKAHKSVTIPTTGEGEPGLSQSQGPAEEVVLETVEAAPLKKSSTIKKSNQPASKPAAAAKATEQVSKPAAPPAKTPLTKDSTAPPPVMRESKPS